jgi:hypothetical protein
MRTIAVGAVFLAASSGIAVPADVTFTGLVANTCTLVATPGLLGLSTDGTVLGSEELGGVPGEVSVVSLGVNTVTVGAPSRTGAPGGYNATGEQVEVSYQGVNGLSGISHAYTTASSNFAVGLLPITVLLVNNRITNANGFAQGTYQTTTVVTCS